MRKTDEDYKRELKPKLTEEFLKTLDQAVRTCGWSVDYIESSQFVAWCFRVAGKEYHQEEPFD